MNLKPHRSARYYSSVLFDCDAYLLENGKYYLFFIFKEKNQNYLKVIESVQSEFSWGSIQSISGALKLAIKSEPIKISSTESDLWAIHHDLKFKLEMNNVLNPGIFLDQEETRNTLKKLLPYKKGKTLLNLFSYTGVFSVHARANGMITTSVDLSKRYLGWEKENMIKNGFTDGFRLIPDDSRKYLERSIKRKEMYDCIIIDPPTFSRNENKVFKVEKELFELAGKAVELLETAGVLCISTNDSNWYERTFAQQAKDFAREKKLEYVSGVIPEEFAQINPKYPLKIAFFIKKN